MHAHNTYGPEPNGWFMFLLWCSLSEIVDHNQKLLYLEFLNALAFGIGIRLEHIHSIKSTFQISFGFKLA